MSGPPRPRSVGAEARPVLGPTSSNKTRSASLTRKQSPKPDKSAEREVEALAAEEKKKTPLTTSLSAPATILRRQELLIRSGFSLDASCSSDASTDSFCSRASTGRIGRPGLVARQKKSTSQQAGRGLLKADRSRMDGAASVSAEFADGKKRCAWVTANTDPCYAAFHDEEWGVPVHDDKRLFELLVLSGALAELPWPVILTKRQIFREVFMDFDPISVAKLNEKKIVAPGSAGSALLSEAKLRAVIENARQILKVKDEFGSFDNYCWGFVNYKPILSRFRYARQVPVKTSKADAISKDLVRRGFRCVGPTVVYTFMQVCGMTNDHLISCYRFNKCCASSSDSTGDHEKDEDADKTNAISGLANTDVLSVSVDELTIG